MREGGGRSCLHVFFLLTHTNQPRRARPRILSFSEARRSIRIRCGNFFPIQGVRPNFQSSVHELTGVQSGHAWLWSYSSPRLPEHTDSVHLPCLKDNQLHALRRSPCFHLGLDPASAAQHSMYAFASRIFFFFCPPPVPTVAKPLLLPWYLSPLIRQRCVHTLQARRYY